MLKTAFISSFSDAHLPIYGEEFFKGFKHIDDPLFFYAENFYLPGTFNFEKTIPEHKNFYYHIQNLKQNVCTTKKQIARLNKALRWSYKSHVIIHALENIDSNYIVWIDGDVQIKKTPPFNLCEDLCGENLLYCYKERVSRMWHIESGFVIFNKTHPKIQNIIDGYKDGYYNFEVLDLPKPWDGFWLYHLSQLSEIEPYCVLQRGMPFHNIKTWFEHDSGKRKFDNYEVDKHLGR